LGILFFTLLFTHLRMTHGGQGLELIHRTALDEVPYAIQPFQNKVIKCTETRGLQRDVVYIG
jgi:hypothetical protein